MATDETRESKTFSGLLTEWQHLTRKYILRALRTLMSSSDTNVSDDDVSECYQELAARVLRIELLPVEQGQKLTYLRKAAWSVAQDYAKKLARERKHQNARYVGCFDITREDSHQKIDPRLERLHSAAEHVLSESERKVYELRLAGFSPSEIALSLDCSTNTVYAHIHSIKKKISSVINQPHFDQSNELSTAIVKSKSNLKNQGEAD